MLSLRPASPSPSAATAASALPALAPSPPTPPGPPPTGRIRTSRFSARIALVLSVVSSFTWTLASPFPLAPHPSTSATCPFKAVAVVRFTILTCTPQCSAALAMSCAAAGWLARTAASYGVSSTSLLGAADSVSGSGSVSLSAFAPALGASPDVFIAGSAPLSNKKETHARCPRTAAAYRAAAMHRCCCCLASVPPAPLPAPPLLLPSSLSPSSCNTSINANLTSLRLPSAAAECNLAAHALAASSAVSSSLNRIFLFFFLG